MTTVICMCGNNEDLLRSRAIDAELQKARKYAKSVKILCSGTGDSGKTTLTRQMKIIHQKGFKQQERREFIPIVINNIVVGTLSILRKIWMDKVSFGSEDADAVLTGESAEERITKSLMNVLTYGEGYSGMPKALVAIIKNITEQKLFWAYFDKFAHLLHVSDGCKYLLQRLDSVATPDYIPTDQDILHTKVLTKGVVQIDFEVVDRVFTIYDVGGQRIERKHWCSVYDDVMCVIFVIALSEYDQVLREDEKMNRMHESIKTFQDLTEQPKLQKKPIILFLNKIDIFNVKIKTTPLSVCFPDCPEDTHYNAEKAKKYIEKKIWSHKGLEVNNSPYYMTKYTHATNTENVKTVFDAVRTFVLSNDLETSGLL